jgi:mycothiol system anti-sigma-R factor
MIDCTEAVRRMWAYLEHVLEPTPADELEAHLDTCQRCCGELEFNDRMRSMVAERSPGPEVPGELRTHLEELLRRSAVEPEARS